MASKARALELLQGIYYDSIDRGDMQRAATALHERIEWSHMQVWEHHEYRREPTAMKIQGRAQVQAYLSERKEKLAQAKIRHKVRELVFDQDKGAFIGAVEGGNRELPFIVWFELQDDLIRRYVLRPL